MQRRTCVWKPVCAMCVFHSALQSIQTRGDAPCRAHSEIRKQDKVKEHCICRQCHLKLARWHLLAASRRWWWIRIQIQVGSYATLQVIGWRLLVDFALGGDLESTGTCTRAQSFLVYMKVSYPAHAWLPRCKLHWYLAQKGRQASH